MTPAIEVTVTNNGMRPISLHRIVCVFRSGYSTEPIRKESSLPLKKLERGDAVDGCVNLHCEPTEIIQILAIDTTAKEWFAGRHEMKAIKAKYARRCLNKPS